MRKITQLVWDKEVLEKVERKHGLTSQQVDEACFNQNRLVLKGPKRGERVRYLVYSQTDAGRYILVVLEPVDRGKVQVVSIRLERGSVNRLKAYAQEIGIPYTTLLRMWIIKSYKREVEEESS